MQLLQTHAIAVSDCEARLPLVTVTIGNDPEELAGLSEHLEQVRKGESAGFQTLIVIRPDIPDTLFAALRRKTACMRNVYLRRLTDETICCFPLQHRTGSFFVTHRRAGSDQPVYLT